MELKLSKYSLDLAEGVDANKFGALRAIAASSEEVEKTFTSYGYNLKGIPGAFAKAYTMNAKEVAEVESSLKEIAEMNMKEIFEANLKLKYFRSKFMSMLKECIRLGLPYLNNDNTFADFFDNEETFEGYLTGAKVGQATIQEEHKYNNEVSFTQNDNAGLEAKANEMSLEEKQIYNEIVEKLNYLVLANPLDTMLASVVSNAINKSVDAILRKEYRYIGVRDMVDSVMLDGLDIASDEKERITSLVLGAFPDDERKLR